MRILNRTRRTGRTSLLAALVGLPLLGCAVATIDVDVYKGPLSHHPEVQVHQMISLATAAKPMLIELRDTLEWGAMTDSCRTKAIDKGWYLAGYVPDPRLECNHDHRGDPVSEAHCEVCAKCSDRVFVTPAARRVNIVLSLYEDLGSGEIASLRGNLGDAWNRLEIAQTAMDRKSGEDRQLAVDLFTELGQVPKSLGSTVRSALTNRASKAKDLASRRSAMLYRLAAFLDRGWAGEVLDGPWITRIAPMLVEDLDDALSRAPNTVPAIGTFRDPSSTWVNSFSTNQSMARLGQSRTQERLLYVLSEIAKEEKAELSPALQTRIRHRLSALSTAYMNGREAIEDLFDTTLKLIETSEPDEHRVYQLYALAAELIDPPYLAWLAQIDETPGDLKKELGTLVSLYFPDHLESKQVRRLAKGTGWQTNDYADARHGIELALRADPESMVKLLAAANVLTRTLGSGTLSAKNAVAMLPKGDEAYWADRQRRAHGITTLPRFVPRNGKWSSVERAYWRFRSEPTVSLGFEASRSTAGLERQIGDYLAAAEQGEGPLLTKRAEDVVGSLVQFANKVLFLANNDELINPPRSTALIPSIFYIAWHHLLGGTIFERLPAKYIGPFKHSLGSLDERQHNYTSVLQAVGNSILVEADEYKKREGFGDEEKARAASERNAILDNFVGSKHAYLTAMVDGIQGEIASLEEMIVVLRKPVATAEKEIKEANEATAKADKGYDKLKKLAPPADPSIATPKAIGASLDVVKKQLADFGDRPKGLNYAIVELRKKIEHLKRWTVPPTSLKKAERDKRFETFRSSLADVYGAREKLLAELSLIDAAGPPPVPSAVGSNSVTPDLIGLQTRLVAGLALDGELPTEAATLKAGAATLTSRLVSWSRDVGAASVAHEPWRGRVRNIKLWLEKPSTVEWTKPPADGASGPNPESSMFKIAEFKSELDQLRSFLEAMKPFSAANVSRAETSRAGLLAVAEQLKAAIGLLEKPLEAIAKERVERESSKKAARAKLAKATKDLKTATDKVVEEEGKSKNLQLAAKVTTDFRVTVDGDEEQTASEIRGVFQDLINDVALNAIKKPELKPILKLLRARRPQVPILAPGDLAKLETPRELVDHVLGLLQHQRAQAILAGGEESEQVTRLSAAYKAILARRASLMRLRPASAFLRTSYPSTSLQDDPGLGWTNQVQAQGLRAIPLLGNVLDFLIPTGYPAEEIQAGIDKRFWQNINRVRVAGTGKSNYVIAKDDIGNWYVKSYDANPQKVLSSAINLGSLAMGAKLGTDVLQRKLARDAAANGEPVPESAAEQSTMGRLTSHHEKVYLQTVIDVHEDLAKELKDDTLIDQLKQVVDASGAEATAKSTMNATVRSASAPHVANAQKALAIKLDLDDEKDDNDVALPHVLTALGALLDYAVELDREFEKGLKAPSDAKSTAEAAQVAAKAKVSASEALMAKAIEDVAEAEKGLTEAKAAFAKSETDETKKALDKASSTHEAAVETRNGKKTELDELMVKLAGAETTLAAATKSLEQSEAIRGQVARVITALHERVLNRLRTAADTYQIALDVVTSSTLD